MAVALEDFDAELNGTTLDLLGDTITYTPSGGAALTFKAIVDHGDEVERLSGSNMVKGDCAVEVPRSKVPTVSGADLVTLPQRPGEQFQPKDWRRDETGMNWLIVLKSKPV